MKIVAIKAAAVVMLLGGCADVAASPPASSAAVTVTNCGAELEVAAPPQRAVAMEQNATEILLTLGLADRMAGIAYQTDPVLPDLAEAYHGVPVLAKLYPNREKVLATQPDFIYSTFTSAYASDAAGPRADLTGLGVPAYLSRFACETAGEKVTFDGIFAEMREIASLFGVAERGATLVAEQAARLDAAKTSPGTTVLWHYSGTSTPYVAGSGGLPAAISERLGLRNVYADAAQPWPAVHHRLGLVDGPVGAQRHGRRAGQRRTRGAGPVKQLLDLWDEQQSAYVAHREHRFTAMLDVLRLHGEPGHVLDLGCGPGALTRRLLDADLAAPTWAASLKADAVVSSTALHWLSTTQLLGVYQVAAALLPPGGLLLNADHLRFDDPSTLHELSGAGGPAPGARAAVRGPPAAAAVLA